MRLEKLVVSGFKSFVDPTTVYLTTNMVGVVGPNGCGKSNVIDAVRWVMGESSAKTLRGQIMADVIFNGSKTRKPVGKASVELLFSNTEGKAGGSYAQFTEISVRRTLSRDGQSFYYLNKTKCRRRDIVDLFRGTGLGARSYSIIEQGMVTRIVEAKAEDLRAFVEEAAGISRYKNRRHETETRIRHTRENLDRVEDIRGELETQLRRLKRQSNAAQRYKVLKEEERVLHGQLLALRYQDLSERLVEHERVNAQFENELQAQLAEQREAEAKLESMREQQAAAQDTMSKVQGEYYAIGAEVSNLEQRIEYARETRQRQQAELKRLQESRNETVAQQEKDHQRLRRIEDQLTELAPRIELGGTQYAEHEVILARTEAQLHAWQQRWEGFSHEAQQPAQQKEVQKSRISQLESQLAQAEQRLGRQQQELETLELETAIAKLDAFRQRVQEHDRECERREQVFGEQEQALQKLRQHHQKQRDELAELRTRHQEYASRKESLLEIQQAALGTDDDVLQSWLEQRGLSGRDKLANQTVVRDGWQLAADCLLKNQLGAIPVSELNGDMLAELPDCELALITKSEVSINRSIDRLPQLLDKIDTDDVDLAPLLEGVFIAEDLPAALTMRDQLSGRECVVARDGTVLGSNWISHPSSSQSATGVLVREEEINQLTEKLESVEQLLARTSEAVAELESQSDELERELGTSRTDLGRLRAERAELHNRLGREESQHHQASERIKTLRQELAELRQQSESQRQELEESRELLINADAQHGTLETWRENLLRKREGLRATLDEVRSALRKSGGELRELELQKQRLEAAADSLREGDGRLQQQQSQIEQRLVAWRQESTTSKQPEDEIQQQLKALLEQRIEVERRLSKARDGVSGFDEQIITIGRQRNEQEQRVSAAREELERHKMRRQEAAVRRNTLSEQILEDRYDLRTILAEMPEVAAIDEWSRQLEEVQRKIERIGPVNLVAIEEYEEQSERKTYLDRQYEDLSQALATLEGVIRKIDRETRSRFRETFDALNQGFGEFFPRLFGGGRAELKLTDEDLLAAGVTVMAQPPGKRNSTIHLLSGGEKALSAVALLFALFKLNPAPFCLLDEVDAPLDDANVERYCKTLRSLAERSQIIVITHNKITMEEADSLIGVTMLEAGVSRTVSVDMEQALQIANEV